ncbi:type II toxin-antitoxin system VapC family toxin [Flavobacterium sp. 3-218]
MAYLLDTSTCVFFLRGKLNLDKKIQEVGLENCYISEIPIFGSIKRYAIEKVRLRKIGKPMNDEFDLLIGVTAIENQLILVTDNTKDFKLLNGIQMENWFERN